MTTRYERETRLWFLTFFAVMVAYACLLAGLGDRCEQRGGQPGLFLPTCGVIRE